MNFATKRWLWSQGFANDFYHAIPADPRASGWIGACGAFCCGEAIDINEIRNGEACPKCLKIEHTP